MYKVIIFPLLFISFYGIVKVKINGKAISNKKIALKE